LLFSDKKGLKQPENNFSTNPNKKTHPTSKHNQDFLIILAVIIVLQYFRKHTTLCRDVIIVECKLSSKMLQTFET